MRERELIEGCVRRNVACQHKLFELYAGKLMTICLRYSHDRAEAEDILQDAFVKIFSGISQYKFDGSFEGWLKKIVVNTALRSLQQNKIRFADINEQSTSLQANTDVLSNLSEEELLKLIGRLPDGYRIVFNLYVMEGYNHNEISAMLGIEAATSRSQLAKARRLLQEQILSLHKIAI